MDISNICYWLRYYWIPNDTYLMRAITGIMLTIFSVNVLIYLFKSIERKLKIKNETF